MYRNVRSRPFVLAAVALAALGAFVAEALAETRSLKLFHLHTREKAEIVYKRDGRYLSDGLRKINLLLRDWRRNEPTKMDPRLLDLVWETYRATGSDAYINVVSAYRAPATNAMLRGRSKGVAKNSQHMLGKAMDFYIPGVSLKKLRDIGLRMQGGGVGYYPTSGSPFVHMDIGNVRHWPGISRQELARVFPNGKTLHVPSDGKPLPGYEQALAAYKSRKAGGTPNIEMASMTGTKRKAGSLLAAFFGGGADEADDVADVASAAPVPKKPARPAVQPKATLPGIAIVAPDQARRAEVEVAADEPEAAPAKETPETIIAALPVRAVPLPAFAPRPKAEVGVEAVAQSVPFGTAEAAPVAVASAATVPGDVPFAMADAAADVPQQQMAAVAAVPLPTWRPEPAQPGSAPQNQGAALLALADVADVRSEENAMPALALLPSPRPTGLAEQARIVPASARPDEIKAMLDKVSREEFRLAKLAPAPVPRSAFSDPFGVDAASPRAAVAARPAGSDPVAALGNVKTTRKEARASARDAKPDRKATVVAAEPNAARWALQAQEETVRMADAGAAPRVAQNLVRTAPAEVYTVGFQKGEGALEANRFTGSAVRFMSVARFQKK